jgi:hypothetical protein
VEGEGIAWKLTNARVASQTGGRTDKVENSLGGGLAMALNYKLILAPSESVKKMLTRRMTFGRASSEEESLKAAGWGAVLLVQGAIPDIFYAADIGAKVSPIYVAEIVGNCPQNVVSMAFVGNIADVKQVLEALKNEGVVA